jgi:hypothetical protein
MSMASRATARIGRMFCVSQRQHECGHDCALYFITVVLIDERSDKVAGVIIQSSDGFVVFISADFACY